MANKYFLYLTGWISAIIALCSALLLITINYLIKVFPRKKISASTVPDNTNASIIILNYKGEKLLKECLSSLKDEVKNENSNHEIIVIDNGSKDGSTDFLKNDYPDIKLIKLNKNRWFSGANNIAAKAAKNNIIVFLNNDITVEKNFLKPLLDRFKDDRTFAVSSRIHMSPDYRGDFLETGATRGGIKDGFFETWQVEPEGTDTEPILYASGCSFAVDKRKFLNLGGFDLLFTPFYYEDTDLSYRARKIGWDIFVEPESNVNHKLRGTNNKKNFKEWFIKGALNKNYLLFVWKNISNTKLLLGHFIALIRRLAIIAPKNNDAAFIAGAYWAYLDFFRLVISKIKYRLNESVTDESIFEEFGK